MKWIIPILLVFIVLASCTQGSGIDDDPRVQEFLRVYPDAVYSEATISATQAESMGDLYEQECPDIGAPFVRATYKQYGATLIAYSSSQEIICVISKIEPGATITQGDPDDAPEGVAMTVNGHPIRFSQIQASLATVPQEQQTIQTINAVLDQLVSQELLRQESSTYDITATEIDAAYTKLYTDAEMTQEDFEGRLVNVTPDAIKTQLESQLRLQKLLNEKLKIDQIDVDETDLQQFYLQNTNSFIVSEQKTFQQIFIAFKDSQNATIDRAQRAVKMLETSDFCAVVSEYSDDADSIERCGVYTIPRGAIMPVIENAVFGMQLNETMIVQSNAGLHIIRLLDTQPAQVMSYAQVQDQLSGLVQGQIAQLRVNAYLASLKSDAELVSYLEVR